MIICWVSSKAELQLTLVCMHKKLTDHSLLLVFVGKSNTLQFLYSHTLFSCCTSKAILLSDDANEELKAQLFLKYYLVHSHTMAVYFNCAINTLLDTESRNSQ